LASFALNLVLIGVIVSWVVNAPPPTVVLVNWQRDLIPELTPEDAATVGDTVDRIAQVQRQGAIAVHEDFGKLRALLVVEPLDRDGLQRILKDMTAVRGEQQSLVGEALYKELTEISPDGRAKIVAALKRESLRWRPPLAAH
jgi:hypothetical protein